jgi:hypothetical protein
VATNLLDSHGHVYVRDTKSVSHLGSFL